jgi:hypothetical protein
MQMRWRRGARPGVIPTPVRIPSRQAPREAQQPEQDQSARTPRGAHLLSWFGMHSRRPNSKPSGPWVSLTGASKQAGVTRRSGVDATPMRSITALLPTGRLSVSCARVLNFDYFLESCSADRHRCRKLESHAYPNRCKLLLPRGMAPTSDAPAPRTHCIDSYPCASSSRRRCVPATPRVRTLRRH